MKWNSNKRKVLYIVTFAVVVLVALAMFRGKSDTEEGNLPEESTVGEQTASDEDMEETIKHESPKTYVEGVIDGSHYENEWLGIQFDAPEGVQMYSRKELNNRVAEAEAQEKESLTMDMYAFSESMGALEILVEKKGTVTNAKEYLEAKQKEMLGNDGEVMQFKNDGTLSKETIAGQEYDCLKLDYTLEGVEFCSERYARIVDECVVVIQINYDPASAADRDAVMNSIREL